MNADEFAELVKSGSVKLRVDEVVLQAEGQIVEGHGVLRVENGELRLDFESSAHSAMPKVERNIWGERDWWTLTGAIEGDLKFSAQGISPGGGRSSWSIGKPEKALHRLHFGDTIDLIPEGLDALTTAERHRLLGSAELRQSAYPSVQFHAVLCGCEPAFLNAGTETRVRNDFLGRSGGGSALDTFIDRSTDYDFAMIKRDRDTQIHFRSKAGFRSKSEEDDWRRFHALLAAIGLTHGFQPWPYRVEYWRGGKKIADKIRVPPKLVKSPHAPFGRGIGFQGNLARKGARNSPIRKAAQLFEQETPLSKQLVHLLFLFREAGDTSVQFHIRTLALCSLFEGIVDLMFEELRLEEKARQADPQFDRFLKARDRLVARLRRFNTANNRQVFDRLAGLLSHAEAFRVKDKLQALCLDLGLDYDRVMNRCFEAWLTERNPRMHGEWRFRESEVPNHALIAGAINVLVLKLAGYSGPIVANAFGGCPAEICTTI